MYRENGKRWIAIALAAGGLALAAPGGEVPIVRDGGAVAEIVLTREANQSMRNAARDLREYLWRISGAELPLVEQPTPGVESRIFVGTNAFTQALGFEPATFTSSGYELYAHGDVIILSGVDRLSRDVPFGMTPAESRYLAGRGPKPEAFPSPSLQAWWDFCGEPFTTWQLDFGGKGRFNKEVGLFKNDDPGTWYAAVELLEQLGVRFYAPYEDGTVIPESRDLALPEQHLKRQAAFGRREWHYSVDVIPDNLRWFKRQKCGNVAPIIFNHTTVAIYGSVMQHERHPEYLACDAEGKPFLRAYGGMPPQAGGVPRYTDPDFRRASVVLMRKLFAASPDLYAVTLGPPDGGVAIDPRDLDRYGEPGDTREQKASNYVWDYHVFLARELQKTHPGKFLIYMSGGGAKEVPTNRRADDPDNLILGFSQTYSANRVLAFADRQVLEDRARWFAAYRPRGLSPVWDYFLYYRRASHPRYPVFFTESLQREMREMRSYSDGKFIEINLASQSSGAQGAAGARIGEPALTHLMVCWQNRLFWDPDADRAAFLEEYHRLYFGPAAAAMQAFHHFAEALWCRQESRSVTPTTGFLKPPDVERTFELLAAARACTEPGSVYERRIAAMEAGYAPLRNLFDSLRRKGPWIRAHTLPDGSQPDGNLAKYAEVWQTLVRSASGETPDENATRICVAFSNDRRRLFLAAVCHESQMPRLRADTHIPDVPSIFTDDVIELYLNSPERSFFKIVVNPNGALWDEAQDVTIIDRDTLPLLWNPGTRATVTRHADRWELDLCVPVEDLGATPARKDSPWGLQVGRTRLTADADESFRLAPGAGRYDTQTQWANLWVE